MPNKTPQGLLPQFGGLEGIDNPREPQARETTTIDKLLGISSRLIPEFAKKTPPTQFNPESDLNYLLSGYYGELYAVLKDIEMKDVAFTEDDLRQFIFANANSDGLNMGIRGSQWLGIFTGCLLQLLTERNESQWNERNDIKGNERNDTNGKRTCFYINGDGNRFDYLFLGARIIHDVFVENFRGDYICSNIAHHDGEAGLVFGRNLKGSHLLSSIADLDGIVKQVIGLTLEGVYAFSGCGQIRGHIHQLVGVDIKGGYYFSRAGADGGHITQLIGVDIDGYDDLETVGRGGEKGSNGTIDWAIFDNLQPDPFSRYTFPTRHYNFETPNSPFHSPFLNETMVKKVRALVKADPPQIMESVRKLYDLKTVNDVLEACFGYKSKIITAQTSS